MHKRQESCLLYSVQLNGPECLPAYTPFSMEANLCASREMVDAMAAACVIVYVCVCVLAVGVISYNIR